MMPDSRVNTDQSVRLRSDGAGAERCLITGTVGMWRRCARANVKWNDYAR